ncbi:hypothetical protein BDK51DRAFT_49275 [Blyttiomyces helicus]|uniref:Uncharacterized protein n=1 Tax=Blyttiomyces helicus TaxID=388810 RepID=A0A4P9VZ36_9FUNG|nr:hypothetical protein BDK51DRAFT_49275 [Blyttiomyces helicus]|eukprot:RKO84245.1 hypothetical protein BDK51DRAFT_49275 [Blyttiomyces helicus]
MLAAAWQYGHRKPILMDSTLGVCLQKILLFVKLVIDESSRGVPVALFLFSVPLGNRQTSSGYDPEILKNDSYRKGRLHWQRRKGKLSHRRSA